MCSNLQIRPQIPPIVSYQTFGKSKPDDDYRILETDIYIGSKTKCVVFLFKKKPNMLAFYNITLEVGTSQTTLKHHC